MVQGTDFDVEKVRQSMIARRKAKAAENMVQNDQEETVAATSTSKRPPSTAKPPTRLFN